MMNVLVGSRNPAKIDAVALAFEALGISVQVRGETVPSDVSEQPFSNDETMKGAVNRARHAIALASADYAVGLEGGVEEGPYGLLLCNWAAVVSRDGFVSVGAGVQILLPDEVAIEVRRGRELGHVIDEWAGGKHIAKREGTIGILTNGHITRAQMFRDATICALSTHLRRVEGV
ncbi:inosine/xanthosine triphosphatase [Alicyclobacillus acidoterrestris]|uniref:Probable inosine/xanthosine triphosphatase n=1 Tax=Alicyclobacillus acidoterrestris (strain ATCC 49025 / DSM 3922 / CIP 106132 / NCIMB 13137 / GD3B) TaxID=1356854 RepID=T0D260_ALIAG|nr:inosine/xanthosine triphosphatase [Alicyclobacillus acidoterrestris]EPZ45647.1 hypothetical protein N007_08365 [Alicyclobacillus acidoterrestris ATCC 49025]UNO47324.1 inosine/xanthosine triphosphatase [Alicyclobacillus acidoterrestris]